MSRNSFQLNFTLRQHTPIIHFQGAQLGAGLRATEVKPKLDLFLAEQLTGLQGEKAKNEIKETHAAWLVGNKAKPAHPAFNYKLKIHWPTTATATAIGNNRNDAPPMFFANMGDDYALNPRHLALTIEAVECEIIVLVAGEAGRELGEKINSILPEFFFQNNFGMRQSKGYGSFTVDRKGWKPRGRFFCVNTKEWKRALVDAEFFYKAMRGGIAIYGAGRVCNYYFKSLMFKYADEKGLVWDKRAIKESIFNIDKKGNGPRRLMRDMLGLSTDQKWGNDGTILKEDQSKEVTRFKSPLLLKPVREGNGFNVYLLHKSVDERMRGRTFHVSKKGGRGFDIQSPSNEEFSTQDYMDWLFLKNDDSLVLDLVGEGFENHEITKKLVNMYNQLREPK